MFPCFRVLIILYMDSWKSQVAHATFIHVCVKNILCPIKCSLPDARNALQHPAAATICPAWAVWYRVQTGAACPASGRVCALHGLRLHLLRSPARGAGGRRGHPGGYGKRPGGWEVSPSTTEKIKKTHPTITKRNPSDCASLRIFSKKTKRPLSLSNLWYT